MNKEQLKQLKKELESNCISLNKFLINYCGIYNKDIHNLKISHQDIKELMPEIKRVSFESLLGSEKSFYVGDIIPVKDCHGNVVPYINPMLEYNSIIEFDCEVTGGQESIDDYVLDEKMSNYELVKICRILKEHNKRKEYREVSKLLKKKKEAKIKKLQKRIKYINKEGREENDKY